MRLRNKKTGYIDNWCIDKDVIRTCDGRIVYNSIAELNADWEDAPEEPDEWWYITRDGTVDSERRLEYSGYNAKQIGNYFSSQEEAEKAVERLRAWQRLKERHFKFDDYDILNQTATWLVSREYDQYENDIKLLFGR